MDELDEVQKERLVRIGIIGLLIYWIVMPDIIAGNIDDIAAGVLIVPEVYFLVRPFLTAKKKEKS